MENLAEMMTFATVVEMQSFSAAAAKLNTSKSLVSKQITTLENALGVRLLNRTTRRMSLTEIGTAYYAHCARIAREIEAAADTVTQLQAVPRGVLRITSPVIFASLHLPAVMESFLRRYEQVQFELDASDRVVDLVEEGYDLAIRITEHPAPGMVARRIAPVHWITCAAPAYLARHGMPRKPEDLSQHQCLVFQGAPALFNEWRYLPNTGAGAQGGKEVAVRVWGNCRVNTSDVHLRLALQGMGIILFPTYVLGPYVRNGSLKRILPEWIANPGTSLYATYMPNRYLQPKVRAFIDHLLEHIGTEPDWDRY